MLWNDFNTAAGRNMLCFIIYTFDFGLIYTDLYYTPNLGFQQSSVQF